MDPVDVFDRNTELYEAWFEENQGLLESELEAIRQVLPPAEKAVEIGVGTGIFASRLGIKEGVEPSENMARRARARGIEVIRGRVEELPLKDSNYDLALMVTVDCFLTDVGRGLEEIKRILVPGGSLVVAFIDRETPLGRIYEENRESSLFYREARFHSAAELEARLEAAGFTILARKQTVFTREDRLQPARDGVGQGVFAVLLARKEK